MAARTQITEPSPDGPMPELPLEPALARELAIALRSIRYGTIELVIHEGRVVQLERREKLRFQQEPRGGR
ncbi:MAG TPA: YezD family protein [Gemmatimonadales bacterium]|nr:YezD family protein [Gemmatimonadales bacterium]